MTEPQLTSIDVYVHLTRSMAGDGPSAALARLVVRLAVEVEALREALARAPGPTRDGYREAYARTATLAHNSAGPTGGLEKVLQRYFPKSPSDDRFAQETGMMGRLGADALEQAALREKMEEVEMYT